MYVSWDAEDGFAVFLERPWYAKRCGIWGGDALMSVKDEDEGDVPSFFALPGFSVPAVPTLWEVTENGVKVVERIE